MVDCSGRFSGMFLLGGGFFHRSGATERHCPARTVLFEFPFCGSHLYINNEQREATVFNSFSNILRRFDGACLNTFVHILLFCLTP